MGISEHKIERFLSGYGDGSGSGDGSGYGYGDGYGSGDGYGLGYGSGDGPGDGSGHGNGYSSGHGNGYGDGDGLGYGDGDGSGSGSGHGLWSINGNKVYNIDDLPTIITNVSGNIAMGFILVHNVYHKPVYIAKHEGYFAHGITAMEAMSEAVRKAKVNMPVEEKISLFIEKFNGKGEIPASELFEWHGILTGSCKTGRETFCINHNINIQKDSFTIDEFISLTISEYGSDTIRKLKDVFDAYKKQ